MESENVVMLDDDDDGDDDDGGAGLSAAAVSSTATGSSATTTVLVAPSLDPGASLVANPSALPSRVPGGGRPWGPEREVAGGGSGEVPVGPELVEVGHPATEAEPMLDAGGEADGGGSGSAASFTAVIAVTDQTVMPTPSAEAVAKVGADPPVVTTGRSQRGEASGINGRGVSGPSCRETVSRCATARAAPDAADCVGPFSWLRPRGRDCDVGSAGDGPCGG